MTKIWDSDPGPGPLPPRWPSLDQVNEHRVSYGLPRLPTSRELTDTLEDHGITDCEGTQYRRVVETAEAAEEAT